MLEIAFEEAFDAVQGFDSAGLAPGDEFGDVHPPICGLAVIDPGLGFADAFAQLPLGQIGLFPQGPKECGDEPIADGVLRLGCHAATMAEDGFDTISVSKDNRARTGPFRF